MVLAGIDKSIRKEGGSSFHNYFGRAGWKLKDKNEVFINFTQAKTQDTGRVY